MSKPGKKSERKSAEPAKSSSKAKLTKSRPAKTRAKAARGKPVPASAPAPAAKEKPTAPAPVKLKRIHGSFTMPQSDYALIAELKATSKQHGRSVKKNELLRAGLNALKALSPEALQAALAALQPAKSPGKPV